MGLKRIRRAKRKLQKRVFGFSRSKVFVIGRNKTGTTSLAEALDSFGYQISDQAAAELLMEDWGRRDFRRIVRHCQSANAFQDSPFSLDFTFQAMDRAFPRSKFILSVRNSAEEWYESLIRFETQVVNQGRIPTAEDLKRHHYRRTGFFWRQHQLIYGIREDQLYDRAIYTAHYRAHNDRVRDYFRHRPDDLLELNLSDVDAMKKLCAFLDVPLANQSMPHLNSSELPESTRHPTTT